MRIYHAAYVVVATATFAQTPAAAPLTFEVASVKTVGPLNMAAMQAGKMPRIGMKIDGAMVDIASFTLKDLIRTAYDVKDYQISGPDWIGSPMTAPRFNIQAKLPDGATEKDVPKMLQALLADRFKLVVHKDDKDHSVYALVIAKSGLKLKEAEPEQPPAATEAPADTPAEPKKGEMVVGQGSSQMRISGDMQGAKGVSIKGGPMGTMHMTMADGHMRMEAERVNMATLAETLTRFLDRPVVDMTELKGDYAIALDLSMDDMKNAAKAAGMGAMMGGGDGKVSTEASEPAGTSIMTSVQRMGLKLDPRKAPLTMIVVDSLEKTPTEN
jgi:uncharacterized protein (TIGR03435 family)